MIIYHGSNEIIKKPIYGFGKTTNDYGSGFYCTESLEMAKEWAVKNNCNGYVNKYEIDLNNLKILDLEDKKYTCLNWIAILLNNRIFSISNELQKTIKEYLISHFLLDISEYDIIKGYRADDSYFSYAVSFINNGLSTATLNKALRLGELGTQIVLVSKKAFETIKYVGYECVDKNIYYSKFKCRDEKARNEYTKIKVSAKNIKDEIYAIDIIRNEIDNNDPRLQ